MFNKTKVDGLYGLVGFEQPANPIYAVVDADNLASSSGRYYTDNPFCKIEWIIDNADYDQATSEQKNDTLETISKSAITHVCDKVFNKVDYIDRQLLYQNANNKINTDELTSGDFVGYRICTSLNKNTAFEFTRILLEFEGTGDLKLYLFNSAQKTALQTKTIAITSTNQAEDLNWVIDYSDVAYYKGEFFIGYLSSEAISAGLTPIKRDYQNANVMSVITFLQFESIKVSNAITDTLFDLESIDGADESWGLNPDITIYNDATDLILQNKRLFARAIQLQGQINALSMIVASNRSSGTQRLSKESVNSILIEIEGIAETNKRGLKQELLQEISTLRKEIKRLNNGYFANNFILNTLT